MWRQSILHRGNEREHVWRDHMRFEVSMRDLPTCRSADA
jgi:hypothetical protein